MDLHRLRPGDWLTGAAGLALLALLWAPWYAVGDGTLSGWQAFGLIDLWLALTALLALALWVLTATRDSPALPVALDVLTTTVAAIAVLLVLVRLGFEPHGDVVTGREWGLYAGVLAVLVLFGAAVWALRDESGPGLRPPPEPQHLPTPPLGSTPHAEP
jgi:carbon starvation protein CstA